MTMQPWHYEPARDYGLPTAKRWQSPQRESGLGESIARLAWRGLLGGYLRLWHRRRIIGLEHLPPRPPYVLVANHTSHLDAPLLSSVVPAQLRDHVLPLAAGDTFFQTPMMSAFAAALLNALPLWRQNCGRHALAQLRERLVGEPCIFILFPEGTRSRDGCLGQFKPGLGMMIAATPVPVLPCAISGAYAALPPGRRLPRPARLTVRIGPPLPFSGVQNDRRGWEQITRQCQAAVASLLESPDQRGGEAD